MENVMLCPVCGGTATPLDLVDFNKSCEESRGIFLPRSGISVCYFLCGACGFCFAPEFTTWAPLDFEEKIYNKDYILIDPDYIDIRPRWYSNVMIDLFSTCCKEIKHLDYGGGNGLMSELLCKRGWRSTSYDPFVNRNTDIENIGRFDLVTAFEVFEHVPDVNDLMRKLTSVLDEKGLLIFSTQLSDNNIKPNERISWWYVSPRNGHISIYARRSLTILAARYGLQFGSFSEDLHAFWRCVPPWAGNVFAMGG